jgi:hypothetical protein
MSEGGAAIIVGAAYGIIGVVAVFYILVEGKQWISKCKA